METPHELVHISVRGVVEPLLLVVLLVHLVVEDIKAVLEQQVHRELVLQEVIALPPQVTALVEAVVLVL
jgi:hypothetical protein